MLFPTCLSLCLSRFLCPSHSTPLSLSPVCLCRRRRSSSVCMADMTASIHGTVHISQLPSILSLWLIGSEFHPNHDDHDTRGEGITAEVIEDTLRDLVGTAANGRPLADAEELTCSEFVTLCDALCAR